MPIGTYHKADQDARNAWNAYRDVQDAWSAARDAYERDYQRARQADTDQSGAHVNGANDTHQADGGTNGTRHEEQAQRPSPPPPPLTAAQLKASGRLLKGCLVSLGALWGNPHARIDYLFIPQARYVVCDPKKH
jgi:hypothetical protein